MLVDSITKIQNESDVLEYKRIVVAGQYYEEFGKLLVKKELIPSDVTDDKEIRGVAKTATYASFFAPNTSFSFTEPMQYFKASYPNVYYIFSRIKFRSKKTEKGMRVHRALAITLQAFEAELFLHKICKRISEMNPEIPIYTIHDSVVTTLEHEETVKQIVTEEISKAIGIKSLALNMEYWVKTYD